MSEKRNGSALPEPQRPPESIVVFYVTQDAGRPAIIQGLGHAVTAIDVLGPSGPPIQQNALKVTFPSTKTIENPVGLVAFGSDPRCHFLLRASDACKVHCKVWAQLNSGPDVWIIEDSSTLGTQVQDHENPCNGIVKTVHGRRQASKGLQSIRIGSSTFSFHAPISNVELQGREGWFRHNPPVPVTKSMLDRQVGEDAYDLCRMDLKPIGEGGNAKVYRYMEKNTALLIAIKEEETQTEKHKRLVMKEINLMKMLRHVSLRHRLMTFADSLKPFLVDILFDDSDNKPLPKMYTAMPLYLGHLRSVLPLPDMPTTERVMLQIAQGLRFMHSNLILHRDLKPRNILVVSPGNIKIADYGWATSLKDTDSLHGVCGTVAYCAPEALNSNDIHTPAIDVYSLGAVFYEMIDLEKVEQGWVMRTFHGRPETFNTTFEDASKSPPRIFAGLVQSMLAPTPKARCPLGECVEIVKAQKYDSTKQTPKIRMATAAHLATSHSVDQKAANPTRLQQTPFGQKGANAKAPKPNPMAQDKLAENRRNLQQDPVAHDSQNQRPVLQRQEPSVSAPQAVPMQKMPYRKPAHVHGVNFNAGLPSYEEATGNNPFAKLVDSRELTRKRCRLKFSPPQNIAGPIAEQCANGVPQNSKKSDKKQVYFNDVVSTSLIKTSVQPHISAIHNRRSASHSTSMTRVCGQHSRNAVRRPREHAQALDVRRLGTGRVQKSRWSGIKAGTADMGKGIWQFGRGLGIATFNTGCLTAEGIMMLYDMARGKSDPAPHAALLLNHEEQQLVAGTRVRSQRREAQRQRAGNTQADGEREDVRLVAAGGGRRLRRISEEREVR